jgi:pimeloyl-ACP methyl ester carboxylesterase
MLANTPLPFSLNPPLPHFMDTELPGTRLHSVRCGSGPPLIIVPATVSLISQWLPLAQFMGQRFTTHFFELPGHGGSTPYPTKFKSQLVPKTVEAFVDQLGYERFNLMGFSFGGLLAMRTLEHLQDRIDRVILLSPCVSQRALKYSASHKIAFQAVAKALKWQVVQWSTHRLMTAKALERPLIYSISKFGNVKRSILESKNALKIPPATLDVFAYTLDEIFNMEYRSASGVFRIPCYFGMSINDDILDYSLTEQIVHEHFPEITIQKFTHPYHQPPKPPTFEWLVQEFGQFLEILDV